MLLETLREWGSIAAYVVSGGAAGVVAASKLRPRLSQDGLEAKKANGEISMIKSLQEQLELQTHRATKADERASQAEMRRLQALEDNLQLQATVRELTSKVGELKVQVETLQRQTDAGNKLLSLALEKLGLASHDELDKALEVAS